MSVWETVLAPSQTVWESPAGVNAVIAPSQTVWESPAGTLKSISGQSSAFFFMSSSFFFHFSAVLIATQYAFMAATVSCHFFR
ncbi:hypothetical protein DPMN_113882 [Dreissena polymorpha]|uniref:Uncharacterized protein n=1 Tax=Dreissena polymorpha TaxID=45954 RepID=A0A9D4QRF8_DREPO|nr:hypothetical protein DPMN_113882 [Dreissena polymorpha]